MTVTNLSAAFAINTPDYYQGYTGGPTVNALGGNKKYPLPFPFSHVELAASGAKQLPVHPSDFMKGGGGPVSLFSTLSPAHEWNQVVQSGLVSVAFAAETGRRDIEELFTNAV